MNHYAAILTYLLPEYAVQCYILQVEVEIFVVYTKRNFVTNQLAQEF